jgi:hypothetical protein
LSWAGVPGDAAQNTQTTVGRVPFRVEGEVGVDEDIVQFIIDHKSCKGTSDIFGQ